MDFIKVLSTFILLAIFATMMKACTIKPTNVDKVEVVAYINGDLRFDSKWLSEYESSMTSGFPYDKYASVTIKVGGSTTCDNNNVCKCPNYIDDEADCTATFQNICAQQILGEEEYRKLLFCAILLVNEEEGQIKGFQTCVDEQSGLAGKITACTQKEGDGSPRAIALKNAKEVIDAGADLINSPGYFFLYNGIFEKCISDDTPYSFLPKICAMLKHNIAKSIASCG